MKAICTYLISGFLVYQYLVRRNFITMYTELPKITRCCFCFPLRYGLLVWAYIKLMFSLFVTFVIVMRNVNSQSRLAHITELIVETIVGVALLIEITITIVFIVGAHKKNPKLLRVYYRYTVVIVSIVFILYLMGIGAEMYACVVTETSSLLYMHDAITIAILSVGSLIINLYLLTLIKNEILKLENNAQFSFTNDSLDPKCVVQNIEGDPENA